MTRGQVLLLDNRSGEHSVVRLEMVDGTEYYVVKSGDTAEIYYRKADLAWNHGQRSRHDRVAGNAT